MNEAKRQRLEAAGWRVGDAGEYVEWLCVGGNAGAGNDAEDGGCGHAEIVGDGGGGGAAVVAAVGCAAEGGGGRC